MQLFCSVCDRTHEVDHLWRALHIDADGDLLLTRPERNGATEYERPGTVFACGEGAALQLVERYLQSGGFEHLPTTAEPFGRHDNF